MKGKIFFAWTLLGTGALLRAQFLYSVGLGDPGNPYDASIPGFVGPHGDGKARIQSGPDSYANSDNIVNPLFVGWAHEVVDYSPAPGVAGNWSDPTNALGSVTGENENVASLGDLSTQQIQDSVSPGSITLRFSKPIRNKSGADLVVFENALGTATSVFAELAYVEVSSDGVSFARFPSVSMTLEPAPGLAHAYLFLDPRGVYGLAGKHINAYGESWGTPFDLTELLEEPSVVDGTVDLNAITHVRIVDIPGNGSFLDSEGSPIYDAWVTMDSGGFDLEAIGVISHDMSYAVWAETLIPNPDLRGENEDAAGDGLPNIFAYALGRAPTLPDDEPSSRGTFREGRLFLEFTRDERAVDLVYEVQSSTDLLTWTTIASSEDGRPFTAVDGHEPVIEEDAAHGIATVGVIRRVRVGAAAQSLQFLRLHVTREDGP